MFFPTCVLTCHILHLSLCAPFCVIYSDLYFSSLKQFSSDVLNLLQIYVLFFTLLSFPPFFFQLLKSSSTFYFVLLQGVLNPTSLSS